MRGTYLARRVAMTPASRKPFKLADAKPVFQRAEIVTHTALKKRRSKKSFGEGLLILTAGSVSGSKPPFMIRGTLLYVCLCVLVSLAQAAESPRGETTLT